MPYHLIRNWNVYARHEIVLIVGSNWIMKWLKVAVFIRNPKEKLVGMIRKVS